MARSDGSAVTFGCLGLIGLAVVYLTFLSAIVWLIATIIHGVFF